MTTLVAVVTTTVSMATTTTGFHVPVASLLAYSMHFKIEGNRERVDSNNFNSIV